MALRNLTDAECGGNNPMIQLSNHLTQDQTFRENYGLVFETASTSESDQLVEQFLQETRTVPQTFQMDSLLQEMREIESQRFALPPVPASKVKDHLNDDTWALQYLQDGKKFELPPNNEDIWAQAEYENARIYEANANEFGLGEEWARDYLQNVNQPETETISTEAKEIQNTATELLQNVNDPKFAYSKFMKFMNQVSDGTVIIENGQLIGDVNENNDQSDDWVEEFTLNNPSEEPAANLDEKWTNEYIRRENPNGTEGNIWDKFQDEWKKLSDKDVTAEHPWISEYSDTYDPYKEYKFSETNPMSAMENPLEMGKEKLAEGDLPSAVLCFEAAVKQEPSMAEAWQLLGITQAENEQDPNAICALKRCLQIDPSNLMAIMSLAVCYTNENYQNQACQTLVSWLRNNDKYTDLVPDNYTYNGSIPSFLSQQQHKEIQDMFIKAVQRNPVNIDYEVQCCLGVLFNLSGEYDKAIDCFKTALQIKPEDSRLWNRLGATLANGSRPEEAVDAYHHALELSPGFIRARYNVGITCINLGAYREAAEHFLIALNQQARGRSVSTNLHSNSQMSETIWSTLRMCVGLMNAPELKTLVDNKDLDGLNKAFDMHSS